MHYGFVIKPNRFGNGILDFLGYIGMLTVVSWTFLTLFLSKALFSLLLSSQQSLGVFGSIETRCVNANPLGPFRRYIEEQKSWLWSSSRFISDLRILCTMLPPAEGGYKANFDAAFFDNSELAGIRVVVRDSSSNIMGALSQKIPRP